MASTWDCEYCRIRFEKELALCKKVDELEKELAEWRSGKRRVFWRVKWSDGASADIRKRKRAFEIKSYQFTKTIRVYRVTTRPKGDG